MTTMTARRQRCTCGKVMSKYSQTCNACHKTRMDKIHTEAREVVKSGICPQCGSALHSNYSMAGWYQCVQYGYMIAGHDTKKPNCNFQCFTE